MKIKVKYLRRLLEELVKKHNVIYERGGLEQICSTIKEKHKIAINPEYLYKKIEQPIRKLKPTDSLGLRDSIVNELLKNIGYDTINAFIQVVDSPVSRQLKSLVGSYYSYVRQNSNEGVLLRSPVRIYEKDKKIFMSLKGERLDYSGEFRMQKGVLFVLLQNEEGKCFHHIYRMGDIERPKVLQGIFSGVTSGFDPIGGRVVLELRSEEYSALKIAALEISTLKSHVQKNDQRLAKYFMKYSDNNLKIGKTSTFGFSDLET